MGLSLFGVLWGWGCDLTWGFIHFQVQSHCWEISLLCSCSPKASICWHWVEPTLSSEATYTPWHGRGFLDMLAASSESARQSCACDRMYVNTLIPSFGLKGRSQTACSGWVVKTEAVRLRRLGPLGTPEVLSAGRTMALLRLNPQTV